MLATFSGPKSAKKRSSHECAAGLRVLDAAVADDVREAVAVYGDEIEVRRTDVWGAPNAGAGRTRARPVLVVFREMGLLR